MLPSIFGENLFDDFFTDPFGVMPAARSNEALYGKHARNLMKTDIREAENSYELDVDLPGFKKDEITVDLKNGYLTISAAKGVDKDEEDKKTRRVIRQERYVGSCQRTFYVGDVKAEDVKCKYESGVLSIEVPKADAKKVEGPHTILIEG